jgi:hypothetical protein
MNTARNAYTIPTVILSLAVVVASVIASVSFVSSRRADRFVTVKGVAERDVEADLALWPLSVARTDDDLGAAQRAVDAALDDVMGFLRGFGIDSTAVSTQGVLVTDRAAERYGRMEPGQMRYIVSQTIMIRTSDLDAILAASQALGRLIEAGVPLAAPDGYAQTRPTYVFTRLNDVKPEMIGEATAAAREAAERFAQDSGSRVGGIRRASQGVFQILPRDDAPGVQEPYERFKRIRVVSTVEYYLDG